MPSRPRPTSGSPRPSAERKALTALVKAACTIEVRVAARFPQIKERSTRPRQGLQPLGKNFHGRVCLRVRRSDDDRPLPCRAGHPLRTAPVEAHAPPLNSSKKVAPFTKIAATSVRPRCLGSVWQKAGRTNATFKFPHKTLDLSALSADALGSVPRFPKPAIRLKTSFGNRWAQEGKIPALPFGPSRPALPPERRTGSAGNVMDCAWIT
jgi:hypothetical protein